MLSTEMERVVKYVQKNYNRDPDSHHDLCVLTASHFGLFDTDSRFPVWLSRIVEGIMRDVDEGIKDV